jgi:hypothetical protein
MSQETKTQREVSYSKLVHPEMMQIPQKTVFSPKKDDGMQRSFHSCSQNSEVQIQQDFTENDDPLAKKGLTVADSSFRP